MNNKSSIATDISILSASLIVIALSVWWSAKSGMLTFTLHQDETLIWHLVRSSGVVSYILLLASTVWGLFISSQFVKNWSPGAVSLTMHSTVSWLALLLGLTHGLLLMFDGYFTYTLADVLVPFIGPYRPLAVGLGTASLWLVVLISLSFPFKKHIGHKTWKRLHYASYLAFGMVSVHGLAAGTDGNLLGFRIIVGLGIGAVLLLLGLRIGKDQAKAAKNSQRTRA